MIIKCSEILEEIQYKNKTFLCQIRVVPRAIKYFHTKNVCTTHRWMQPELWAEFDEGMQQVLERCVANKSKPLDDEHFYLNALVRVRVRMARTSIEALCCCVSKNGLLVAENVTMALECVIEYSANKQWKINHCNKEAEIIKESCRSKTTNYEPQIIEYENQKDIQEYEPQKIGSEEPFIPYTPSAIGNALTKNTDDEELEPYIIANVNFGEGSPKSSPTQLYKALPLKSPQAMSNRFSESFESKEENLNSSSEIEQWEKYENIKENLKKQKIESDCDLFKEKNLESTYFKINKSKRETNAEHKKSLMFVGNSQEAQNQIRRSPRSRARPRRLIEESHSKCKKTDNLFENNALDGECFEKHTVQIAVNKGKRKRELVSGHCSKEQTTINCWLSKANKTEETLKSYKIDRNSSSAMKVRKIVHKPSASTEKNNTKEPKETNVKQTSSPPNVAILSLNQISSEEILKSFDNYKPTLDKIYNQFKDKGYIRSHKGIDHCFVITLVAHDTQLKMLQKLNEIYGTDKPNRFAGSTTLFANALLPEWVIHLFMEHYNMTRDEAIKQISAQEDYALYLQVQSEDLFGGDVK